MNRTITIIDTFGFFFRSYYALPQYLKTKDGFPTGLITGFLNYIQHLIKDEASTHILFAMDAKGSTFREEIYKEYKAHRDPPPPDLLKQLPVAIELIEKMGYKSLSVEGYEADDVIASVAKMAKKQGIKVRIVSHDKDLNQLIDDGRVVLVDAVKKVELDEDGCKQKYGITPLEFRSYQAIVGDSADNVPGVKGIGKVGATKLIHDFGSLDGIYANLDKITQKAMRAKLEASKKEAFISFDLVSLRDDLFESIEFDELLINSRDPFANIVKELERYEQNAILRSLKAKEQLVAKRDSLFDEEDLKVERSGVAFEAKLITEKSELDALLSRLDENTIVAFDTETSGLEYRSDHLVGFSFCFEPHIAYYVPIDHNYLGVPKQISKQDAMSAIEQIFRSCVVGHNIKFDLHFIKNLSEANFSVEMDTMILAWLADNSSRLSLDTLSDELLGYKMVPFKDVVKKGENFSSVSLENATLYAAEDALITLRIYNLLASKLSPDLMRLAKEVEVPFISTLLRMEREGIKVDTTKLAKLKEEFAEVLASLKRQIFELSSSEFNLNSPQQVSRVLFEELALPTQKRTKTGFSTNEESLKMLVDLHPVVAKLLEYREIHKLQSTYAEPLLALARSSIDRRVHTSFLQVGTATGRLSSSNPNLQNIPARGEFGLKIREVFVASEGKLLIGIDYSQIELRLLAHFSGDEVLVRAFFEDQDIHLATASMLFGEDEAKAKRDIAKTVNFGLLYGMGPKRLSETLSIPYAEAKEIIERYFKLFPSVKSYFASIIKSSRDLGFTQMLLGRRRYFDYQKANAMQQASFEREAVNSIFQGSASDLIKLAMNSIDRIIIEEDLSAKMLLQIHDELIFEADESEAKELGKRFQSVMQNIYKLNIPLKATLNIGKNWSQLK
ncbi:MAG: DNA polymerase I [Sulfuricurvum sp.]